MTILKMRMKANDRGTVLVESALTFLTFIIVIFGIMEAGRLMNVQQTLTDAAREGASRAVMPLTQSDTMMTEAEVAAWATDFLNAANIPCSGCVHLLRTTVINCAGCPTINVARVTIDAPYRLITLSMFSNLSFTMHGRAVMREETSAN